MTRYATTDCAVECTQQPVFAKIMDRLSFWLSIAQDTECAVEIIRGRTFGCPPQPPGAQATAQPPTASGFDAEFDQLAEILSRRLRNTDDALRDLNARI